MNKNLDPNLAYQMTKVAFDHMDEIRKVINVMQFTTVENMNKLDGIALHPGAEKYRQEQMSQ